MQVASPAALSWPPPTSPAGRWTPGWPKRGLEGTAFRWRLVAALPGVDAHAEDELVGAMARGDPADGSLWMSCDEGSPFLSPARRSTDGAGCSALVDEAGSASSRCASG